MIDVLEHVVSSNCNVCKFNQRYEDYSCHIYYIYIYICMSILNFVSNKFYFRAMISSYGKERNTQRNVTFQSG